MRIDAVVVTCEHGGNRVPTECAGLFTGAGKILDSHRGYDAGALDLARRLARGLGAPLVASTISRLVVDCNRSPTGRGVFSSFTRALSPADRSRLLTRYHTPFRERSRRAIDAAGSGNRTVLQLSVHSFTPVLDGVERTAEIGLLYDPSRRSERTLCEAWARALKLRAPGWRIRRNYPYLGRSDGHTTALRRVLPPSRYVGIELEANRLLATAGAATRRRLVRALLDSLSDCRSL